MVRNVLEFAVEQFLAARHLGIISILDFEPPCSLGLGHVWPIAVFRYDALQVHLAHALK
jgi:hypothetical protein